MYLMKRSGRASVPVIRGFVCNIKALLFPEHSKSFGGRYRAKKKCVMFLNPGIRSCLLRTLSHFAGSFPLEVNIEVHSVCSASVKGTVHD